MYEGCSESKFYFGTERWRVGVVTSSLWQHTQGLSKPYNLVFVQIHAYWAAASTLSSKFTKIELTFWTPFVNSTLAHQLLLYLNTTSCHEDTKQFSLNSYFIFLPNLSFLVTNCDQRLCLSQKINLLKCSRSPTFFERADIIFIFSILPQEVVKKFFLGCPY